MALNVGYFIGRLSATPVLKTKENTKYLHFTLIQSYNDDEKTAIDFVAFSKIAMVIAENCRKGDKLIVTYELRNSRFRDDQGIEHFKNSLIAYAIEFAGAAAETRRYLRGIEMDKKADKNNLNYRSINDLV